jgi:hypothetical protein
LSLCVSIPHHNNNNKGLSPSSPLACRNRVLVVDLVYFNSI